MTDNTLPAIVRPAERGSKDGWETVSGEVPPDLFLQLVGLVNSLGRFRTDLVREGVELLVAKYEATADSERRVSNDRRKAG